MKCKNEQEYSEMTKEELSEQRTIIKEKSLKAFKEIHGRRKEVTVLNNILYELQHCLNTGELQYDIPSIPENVTLTTEQGVIFDRDIKKALSSQDTHSIKVIETSIKSETSRILSSLAQRNDTYDRLRRELSLMNELLQD